MRLGQIMLKTSNCLEKYGLVFTLRQICFLFFHGPDPMTVDGIPQCHESFLERKRKPRTDLNAAAPLDLQFLPERTRTVVNLVLDRLLLEDDSAVSALAQGCNLACLSDASLRVITRLEPADAGKVLTFLQDKKANLPATMEFISDYMRNAAGKCHTPIPVGTGDRFYNCRMEEMKW